MFRWRSGPFSPASDLPAVRRGLWAVTMVLTVAAIWAWIRFEHEFLIGPLDEGGPWQVLRFVLVFTVPIGLVVALVYAIFRFQLERLAYQPGPLLVIPFRDPAGAAAAGADGEASERRPGHDDSPLATELTAMFQQHVVRSRVYGSTAIPSGGWAADFLTVIERAGDSAAGVWGIVGRLPRVLFPVSAYQVECTILPPESGVPGDPADGRFALLVELTRFPRSLVAPIVVRDESRERAVERAAHWVAGAILPRTRQCRFPPWTMWRRLRLPDNLFDHYQQYQQHLRARELDAAMGALRVALSLDPGNLALRLELGKLQEQLGMQLDALATYEELIGRASRGHRGLALLWNLPPSAWGTGAEPDDGDDPAWSDARRISQLPARHPVVYVARYRHMLLLGLGDRLAEQWWLAPFARHDRPPAEDSQGCLRKEHWPAHERRSEYSRRILARRLADRYEWIVQALIKRKLLSETREPFLREIGHDQSPESAEQGEAGIPQELATELAIFMTTTSVCELELLLLERGTDLTTRPSVREVVSRRSLELVLPWGVLRAGLTIQNANRRTDRAHYLPQLAGKSIVRRRTRPDILGERGRGLLDDGWPPDLDVLKSYVAHALRSRIRTLHSWHEHYNAACTFAVTLLRPRDAAGEGIDHKFEREEAAKVAVRQLYKAIARGDSGFLASQRDWLLTQDPDLDVLRGTETFFELEAATYGSVRATGRRGPNMVTWQIRTYTTRILADLATRMTEEWDVRRSISNASRRTRRGFHRTREGDVRRSVSDAEPDDLRNWLDLEEAAWEIVEGLCRDHRDSATRQAAVNEIRERCGSLAWRPSQVHPRFSEKILDRQCASQKIARALPATPQQDRIAEQVRGVVANAAARFDATAAALRRENHENNACCVREWDLVTTVEIADMRPLIDRSVPHPLAGQNLVRLAGWAERSRKRWMAMSELFDDEIAHGTSVSERQQSLRELF